jgi:hypothetical protein
MSFKDYCEHNILTFPHTAGGAGIEPTFTVPKTGVRPLDDPPALCTKATTVEYFKIKTFSSFFRFPRLSQGGVAILMDGAVMLGARFIQVVESVYSTPALVPSPANRLWRLDHND